MENIAIIPARSGSKGLRDKNIKELNGKPLMYYSIQAALQSNIFAEVMVSTDSEKYAEVAKNCGANVPFFRSDEMSSDTAGSWDVVKEVLYKYKKRGKVFETVCLLQPTSPLRDEEDIKKAYQLLNDKNADAITSVCEVDHSPLWTMILPDDCSLEEYNRTSSTDAPRQQLATYHRFNGAIYIRKVKYEENEIKLLETKEYAFIMEREKSIDIDTALDFVIAECLQKNDTDALL